MKEITRDADAFAAVEARRAELARTPKSQLVTMHVQNGGQMGRETYSRWAKEELINAVLEDEGHLWHPGSGAPE